MKLKEIVPSALCLVLSAKKLFAAALVAVAGFAAYAEDAPEEAVVATGEASFWLGGDEVVVASGEGGFWLGPDEIVVASDEKEFRLGPKVVEVTLPAGVEGYSYVVSNLTAGAEIAVSASVPGGATYALPIGAKIAIYAVPADGYAVTGTNPYAIESVTAETTINANDLPKADKVLTPVAYLDWDEANKVLTNATCTAYEVYAGQTTLAAGKTYVVMGDITNTATITVNGTVANPTRLILCDGAKLTVNGGTSEPGISVVGDTSLFVYGQELGTGELIANGGSGNGYAGGAGIGGRYQADGGKVTINGGTVTATGGLYASGIGGGDGGSGGDVTVYGGTVTVTGGQGAQGLGGGSGKGGGTNRIFGGTVKAEGGAGAYGIGGDRIELGSNMVMFNITDGEPGVVVTGSYFQIRKSFTTEREPPVPAPGFPYLDWDGEKMTNATCTVYEEYTNQTTLAAGKTYVVTGDVTNAATITVKGTVANPTRLILCDGAKLTATNGVTVTVNGATTNALIICGQENGTGALEATGGQYAAGIGGGDGGAGGTVTINGGTVTATGSSFAAGIGGGGGARGGGAGGSVTINGGIVTATGGGSGAGIGGGYSAIGSGAGGTVTINGGTVTAQGGSSAAGIGGGGAGGTITINGGTVTATGKRGSAGIGGGLRGAGGTVTINGGTVTATGKDGGAGIGGGASATDPGTLEFADDLTFVVKAGATAASAAYVTQTAYTNDHSAAYVTLKPGCALKIPAGVNYAYAVTNTAETLVVPATLEGATNVYAFATNDSYAVTYTPDYGYEWVTAPAANPLTGTITADTNLTALTVKALGANVEFNAMGGVHTNGLEVITNFCIVTYALPEVKREGYTLDGWYNDWKPGATKVEDGQDLLSYEPHPLYAVWTANKPTPTAGELDIPDITNNVPVTSIEAKQYVNNTSLEHVTTPLYLQSIGQRAFMGCTSLKKLTITPARNYDDLSPVTVAVGQNAFSGCSSLEVLTIAGDISLGQSAFQNCAKLKKIVFLGDDTIAYGASAFYRCGYQNDTGSLKVYMSSAFQSANKDKLIADLKRWNTQLKIIEKVDVEPVEGIGNIDIDFGMLSEDRTAVVIVKTSARGTPDPGDVNVQYRATMGDAWSLLTEGTVKTAYPDGTVWVEIKVPEGPSGFFRAVVTE